MAFDPDMQFFILLHGFDQIVKDNIRRGQRDAATAIKNDVFQDEAGSDAGIGVCYGLIDGPRGLGGRGGRRVAGRRLWSGLWSKVVVGAAVGAVVGAVVGASFQYDADFRLSARPKSVLLSATG